MAHRGRLNVLANVIGKSYEQIFREFEGELDPSSIAGLGRREVPPRRDRQARVARRATRSRSRSPRTRATSRRSTRSSRAWRGAIGDAMRRRPTGAAVLPVLVHGDAAFAGQGVVAETFNLSEVPGLRGRRHRARRRQQPARLHHRARARPLERVPDRRRQDGAGADLPRERRRPRSRGARDPPRVRVPAARSRRTSSSTSSATAATATTRPTSPRSPSRACTSSSTRTRRCASSTRSSSCSAATSPPTSERALEADFQARLDHAFEADARRPRRRARRRRRRSAVDGDADERRASTTPSRPRCRRPCSSASSTALTHVARRLRRAPEARAPAAARRRTTFDARRDRLGARRGAGVRHRSCSRARRCGSPARTPGAARSASATACSSTSAPRREYVPLAHLADDQAPFMLYDTVLSEYAALGFEYGYSIVVATRSCAGRRSSATSPTARRS